MNSLRSHTFIISSHFLRRFLSLAQDPCHSQWGLYYLLMLCHCVEPGFFNHDTNIGLILFLLSLSSLFLWNKHLEVLHLFRSQLISISRPNMGHKRSYLFLVVPEDFYYSIVLNSNDNSKHHCIIWCLYGFTKIILIIWYFWYSVVSCWMKPNSTSSIELEI